MADQDDLRGFVARGMQRLTDDVLMDRYGDPHVAFTVLLYPDSPPRIVALTPAGSGACELSRLQFSESDEDSMQSPRFFTLGELEDAGRALDGAGMGLRLARKESPGTLGFQIMDWVARTWERSRTYAIDTALKVAAVEQARPMVCPSCRSRYTKRGFPQHLRMSRYCGRRVEVGTDGEGRLLEVGQ